MKKLLILTIFILLVAINEFTIKKESSSVFYVSNNEVYRFLCLDISKINITTKNLTDYFNANLISIRGNVDQVYNERIKDHLYYVFDNKTYENNLERYEKKVSEKLFDFGYKTDSYLIKINGVKIESIVIYTSESDVSNIIKKYSGINYCSI